MNHLMFGLFVFALCLGAVALLVLAMISLGNKKRAYTALHVFWSGVTLMMVYHVSVMYAEVVHILKHPATVSAVLGLASIGVFAIWVGLPMLYCAVHDRPFSGAMKWPFIIVGVSYPVIFIVGALLTDTFDSLSYFLVPPMRMLDAALFIIMNVFFIRIIKRMKTPEHHDRMLLIVLTTALVTMPYLLADIIIDIYSHFATGGHGVNLRSLLVMYMTVSVAIIATGIYGVGKSRSLIGSGVAAFAEANSLTPRETDIFRLLIEGRTNTEISATLGISLPTVKTHVSRVLAKTDCESRANLIARIGEYAGEEA